MKLLISFVALSIVAGLLLQIAIYPASIYYFLKKLFKLTFILALMLLLIGWWASPAALAEVSFLKEAEQWLYQSQTELVDKASNLWEVTAINQMEGAPKGFYLRVETESPSVQLDAAEPLVVITNRGEPLNFPNVTRQQFVGELPDDTVGQYDIQSLLYKVKGARSLRLILPTRKGSPIELTVPFETLEEWTEVGTCEYLICVPDY